MTLEFDFPNFIDSSEGTPSSLSSMTSLCVGQRLCQILCISRRLPPTAVGLGSNRLIYWHSNTLIQFIYLCFCNAHLLLLGFKPHRLYVFIKDTVILSVTRIS